MEKKTNSELTFTLTINGNLDGGDCYMAAEDAVRHAGEFLKKEYPGCTVDHVNEQALGTWVEGHGIDADGDNWDEQVNGEWDNMVAEKVWNYLCCDPKCFNDWKQD